MGKSRDLLLTGVSIVLLCIFNSCIASKDDGPNIHNGNSINLPTSAEGWFLGTWTKFDSNLGIEGAGFVSRPRGAIGLLVTRDNGWADLSVQLVQGRVLVCFFEGCSWEVLDDKLLLMRMSGVYFRDTGRMHVLLEPEMPLVVAALEQKTDDTCEQYRSNLTSLKDTYLRQHITAVSDSSSGPAPLLPPTSMFPSTRYACTFFLDVTLSDALDSTYFRLARFLPGATRQAGADSQARVTGLNGNLTSPSCGSTLLISASTKNDELRRLAHWTVPRALLLFVVQFFAQPSLDIDPHQLLRFSSVSAALQLLLSTLTQALYLLLIVTDSRLGPLFFVWLLPITSLVFACRVLSALREEAKARRSGLPMAKPVNDVQYLNMLIVSVVGGVFMFRYVDMLPTLPVMFALYSFWMPQIVTSISTRTRPPYNPLHMLGMSACHLVTPLYFLLCPTNVLRLAPQPLVAGVLGIYVGGQVALLLLLWLLLPQHVLQPDRPAAYHELTQSEPNAEPA